MGLLIFLFLTVKDGIIGQNDIFFKAHNVPVNSQNQADPYCSNNTFLLIASSPLTSAIYTVLSLHVTQSDETPTQVIKDSDRPNSKCYMWMHRSGEFYGNRPIVIYEYQKGLDHKSPLEFYNKEIFVTALVNNKIFRLEEIYKYMFENIFSPVLDRYH